MKLSSFLGKNIPYSLSESLGEDVDKFSKHVNYYIHSLFCVLYSELISTFYQFIELFLFHKIEILSEF